MRDDAQPYGSVIFHLSWLDNYLGKDPDRIGLGGVGRRFYVLAARTIGVDGWMEAA